MHVTTSVSPVSFRLRLRSLLCAFFVLLALWTVQHDESLVVADAPEVARLTLSSRMLEAAEKKYGARARQRLEAWQKVAQSSRDRPDSAKLKQVNDFFNQIPFVSDQEHWGANDYWATPSEMLVTNGGDCEDFSIAKYFTLLMLGVSMDKLKITYVKARNPNWTPTSQAHMVLTYYADPKAVPLVLDNLIGEIKPANQRSDLTPVYAFNGSGLWLAQQRGTGKNVEGGSSNIGFWRELNARIGKEFD